MTLTDDSAGTKTVREFYTAWNKLRTRLTRDRKGGAYVAEYAAVIEVQTRGALHLHVVMTGRFIHHRKLAAMAEAAGFGRCTDIRLVQPATASNRAGSAEYVTKQLAGYLTKQAAAALSEKTNVRRRPFRVSRGWAGGLSLRKAEQQMAADMRDQVAAQTGEDRDTGPFAFVQVLANGDVFIRVGEHVEIQLSHPPGLAPMPLDGALWLAMYGRAPGAAPPVTKPTAGAGAPPPGRASATPGAFGPARAAPARTETP